MKTARLLTACLPIAACLAPSPAVPVSRPPEVFGEVFREPAPTSSIAAESVPRARPLFERLGGKPMIVAVVDDWVNRTIADARVKDRFFNTDPVTLKTLLADVVCETVGGPCKYTGHDTMAANTLELVDDEFKAVVENLTGALEKARIAPVERYEVLGAIGSKKSAVVVATTLRPIEPVKLAKVTELAATLENKPAAELLTRAVIAGHRGQRAYAEQLLSRAELAVGVERLASVAAIFREGAPPRLDTPLKAAPTGATPQPAKSVGTSDEPNHDRVVASLTGTLLLDGRPIPGLGVVMLIPHEGGTKRVPQQRVIEQRGKEFAPHILAVPVGSTVLFPNFDKIFHNVFSRSTPRAFDLGMYKTGNLREVTFDKPGIVRLGCSLHSNMSAYVVVVDAPHYVVVNDDGTFAFRSIAPGRYTVRAWSEKSGDPVQSQLIVVPGKNARTIDLKTSVAPGPSPDKFGVARTIVRTMSEK